MAGPKNKNEDERTFWSRLRKASDYAEVSCLPGDVAKELGVAPSAVTKYIDGGFPKKENINKLAARRKVRSEWLLSGQGPMISEKDLDTETQELLRLWRNLDEDAKQRLLTNARYEHTTAMVLTTGKRAALTDQIIEFMKTRDRQ